MKKLLRVTTFLIFAVKILFQNTGIGNVTANYISIINTLPSFGITDSFGSINTYFSNLNAQFGAKTTHSLQLFSKYCNAQITIHRMEIPEWVQLTALKNWI